MSTSYPQSTCSLHDNCPDILHTVCTFYFSFFVWFVCSYVHYVISRKGVLCKGKHVPYRNTFPIKTLIRFTKTNINRYYNPNVYSLSSYNLTQMTVYPGRRALVNLPYSVVCYESSTYTLITLLRYADATSNSTVPVYTMYYCRSLHVTFPE
jgi:hypothetical protein